MNQRILIKTVAILTVAAIAFGLTQHVVQACFMRSPQPVHVWLDHINVDITDQVAVKTYNCTFRNPNPRAVVGGTCFMELEPGAQVDDMSVLVDGKELRAEILDVDKAKQVFGDMVKQGGSPALLEYYGNQLIQTQIPRVPPNGTVTVKLKYTTVLPKRGGLVRLQMLNTNPKALMQPLKSASVTVNIKSTAPIKNIYSPTHAINIGEKAGWDVSVQWSQENYLPKHPFVMYYQVADETVSASLLAHREPGEDGSFLMMLSPTMGQGSGRVTEKQILPKDVVFCVDTSGSMLQGQKMEQARAALRYCVEHLRPGDRFNIIDFSTLPRHFHDGGLIDFSEQTRKQASLYINKLAARGGTAIQDALQLSLQQFDPSDRLKMILFATDGHPTIGETKPQAILKNMVQQNNQDVRVFVFGEGFDVNTRLLDFLALDHRGEADYILPEEDITKKISRFFDRVGSPIMTDLRLKFDGMNVNDVFPPQITDLVKGEQVIIFGRYKGRGPVKVTLTGTVRDERKSFDYTLNFPHSTPDDRNAFVPRLWAGAKVDFLLNEIRKAAQPPQELVDEVTTLAKEYGIVTPFTSFLMGENLISQSKHQLGLSLRGGLEAAGEADSAPAASTAKRDRVRQAQLSSLFRRSNRKSGAVGGFSEQADMLQMMMGGVGGAANGRDGSTLSLIRHIGTRTFYKQGPHWYDSRYSPKQHKSLKDVKVGSDKYFQLLKNNVRIAKYLALGDVTVEIKGVWYRFRS